MKPTNLSRNISDRFLEILRLLRSHQSHATLFGLHYWRKHARVNPSSRPSFLTISKFGIFQGLRIKSKVALICWTQMHALVVCATVEHRSRVNQAISPKCEFVHNTSASLLARCQSPNLTQASMGCKAVLCLNRICHILHSKPLIDSWQGSTNMLLHVYPWEVSNCVIADHSQICDGLPQ